MFKNIPIYYSILLFLGCASYDINDMEINTTTSISIEEKVGQMIMIRMDGKFHNSESSRKKYIKDLISNYKIGGLITFSGSVHGTFNNIKHYQNISDTPLLIASDYERGIGVFVDGTLFPSNMALAATQDTSYAYMQGKITAIEAKSLGVNMILAPVLDINNNKNNPIINFRSYGDTPETVIKYGIPFIRGIEDNGLIACAKHYPGHGNTATDSHTSLPTIDITKEELYQNELYPFRKACSIGVKSIMVGHIMIPSMDKNNPSTFSKKITEDILRDEWDYPGLIITDALEMGALTSTTWHGESAIRAINAGADIVLLPIDAKLAINSIISAVANGRISEKRIDDSYNRILAIKNDMKLEINNKNRTWEDSEGSIGLNEHSMIASRIAEKSITLVKNRNNVLPLNPNKYNKVSHILLSTDNDLRSRLKPFVRDLKYIHGNVNEIYVNDPISELLMEDILIKVKDSDLVVVSMLIRISMDKGLSTIHESHSKLLENLHSTKIPMVGISFGSPYLPKYNYLDSYLCSYGYGRVSLSAITNAVFGRRSITGVLPVTLNDKYQFGHGLRLKKNDKIFESKLNIDIPNAFTIINNAISSNIFPGAQLFVSRGDSILVNKSFGRYTYDPESPIVVNESIYDVASLTKVLSTTPVVMKLIQKKLLSLDYFLSDFYKEFEYGDKKNITIRHLLTHTSGLPAYVEYYKNDYIKNKEDIINDIINLDLIYKPDTKTEYSDLGMILLSDIIEIITSSNLHTLSTKYFYNPLGMSNTLFNPSELLLSRIIPTENDTYFRNRLLQGEVHDENAYIMGGISGHAGLFSNATDIGIISRFFLDEGVCLGRRYLKKELINTFTSKKENPVFSDRTIGWDTPSQNGKSSAGDYFSKKSYGHLGFTGTSVWIDPEKKIIITFLTNRIHPSREKKGIYEVRRELHNSIMSYIN